jgi:hypothetical protein
MGKSQKKSHLSPNERSEVLNLYRTGNYSYRQLGEKFGCSHTTIKRIVNEDNKINIPPEQRDSSGGIVPSSNVEQTNGTSIIDDPLQFRRAKLVEIAGDIISTRLRGSVQVLPQLHRLHIQTHDEITAMRRELEEMDGMTDPDEIFQTIAIAVNGLPPILKEKLIDVLSVDYSNVIPFKQGEK